MMMLRIGPRALARRGFRYLPPRRDYSCLTRHQSTPPPRHDATAARPQPLYFIFTTSGQHQGNKEASPHVNAARSRLRRRRTVSGTEMLTGWRYHHRGLHLF